MSRLDVDDGAQPERSGYQRVGTSRRPDVKLSHFELQTGRYARLDTHRLDYALISCGPSHVAFEPSVDANFPQNRVEVVRSG